MVATVSEWIEGLKLVCPAALKEHPHWENSEVYFNALSYCSRQGWRVESVSQLGLHQVRLFFPIALQVEIEEGESAKMEQIDSAWCESLTGSLVSVVLTALEYQMGIKKAE